MCGEVFTEITEKSPTPLQDLPDGDLSIAKHNRPICWRKIGAAELEMQLMRLCTFRNARDINVIIYDLAPLYELQQYRRRQRTGLA